MLLLLINRRQLGLNKCLLTYTLILGLSQTSVRMAVQALVVMVDIYFEWSRLLDHIMHYMVYIKKDCGRTLALLFLFKIALLRVPASTKNVGAEYTYLGWSQ